MLAKSLRRRLADRVAAFPRPAIYELPIVEIGLSKASLLAFQSFKHPEIKQVPTIWMGEIERIDLIRVPSITTPVDLEDGLPHNVSIAFENIEIPEVWQIPVLSVANVEWIGFIDLPPVDAPFGIGNDFLLLIHFEVPQLLHLFETLRYPKRAGKVFNPLIDTNSDSQLGTNRPKQLDLGLRCKHGMARRLCADCKSQEERRRKSRQKRAPRRLPTIDVFEQLRYILQPPILERLGDPVVFPEGRKPYPFQIVGIQWLIDRPGALLADEMGLGKTVQAIVAMRILFRRGELQRVIVVCPASVGSTWEREIKDWAPELTSLLVRGSRWERDSKWQTPAEVYIVSYETLSRDVNNTGVIPGNSFELCIADEAQKIKNRSTKNARAMKSVARNARYRWALTGTPLENAIDDTVSIFEFVLPGLFREQWEDTNSKSAKITEPYPTRKRKERLNAGTSASKSAFADEHAKFIEAITVAFDRDDDYHAIDLWKQYNDETPDNVVDDLKFAKSELKTWMGHEVNQSFESKLMTFLNRTYRESRGDYILD